MLYTLVIFKINDSVFFDLDFRVFTNNYIIYLFIYCKHQLNTLEVEKLKKKLGKLKTIENLKCQFLINRHTNTLNFKHCDLKIEDNIIFVFGYNKVFNRKINRKSIIFYSNGISHNFYHYKKYKVLKIILRHIIDNGLEITLSTARKDGINQEMIIYGLTDNQKVEIINRLFKKKTL